MFAPRVRLLLRTMRHIFPSSHYALLALFFFAGLELSFALRRYVILLISIILTITVIGIILIRSEERGGFHPTQAILPILAALGISAFSLFLPTSTILHGYFALAAVTFFFIVKHGARQAYPTWNWVISLGILFVTLASVLGWRFNLYAPVYVVLGMVFSIILALSIQSLIRYTKSLAEAWLLAMAMAFVLTEVVWVLQFLPLHFMVQAGIVVALYYVTFQLTSASVEQRLQRQEIIEHLLVGSGALAVLLITARWT